MSQDPFNAKDTLKTSAGEYTIWRLDKLEADGHTQLSRLPFSIRVLLEAALRQVNGRDVTEQDVLNLAGWQPTADERPARKSVV